MRHVPPHPVDSRLRYAVDGFRFGERPRLLLGPLYRRNQLPLVNPDHPDVIRRSADSDYEDGRYPTPRLSLIAFVPFSALAASPEYGRLAAGLEGLALRRKIAWDLFERRRDLLHLTICAGLHERVPPLDTADVAARLAEVPAFDIDVRGPWISDRGSAGRLYLPVYPEMHGEADAVERVQVRLGGAPTRFYAIGFYNLVDHLTEAETAELSGLVGEFRERVLVRHSVRELCLVSTHDDLLLDSRVVRRIPLSPR